MPSNAAKESSFGKFLLSNFKDLGIWNQKNKIQTISLIGEYIYTPSCNKIFEEIVTYFYTFGIKFSYYIILNQNA